MYKKPAFQPPKAKSGSSLTSDSSDGEVKPSHKPNLAGDGDQHLGGMLIIDHDYVIIMDKMMLFLLDLFLNASSKSLIENQKNSDLLLVFYYT